jgi:hypothetical protein
MVGQDVPNGVGRARKRQALLEVAILIEIVEDGFGTRNTTEFGRWVITNGENTFDDFGGETSRRVFGARERLCTTSRSSEGAWRKRLTHFLTQPRERLIASAKSECR